MVQSFGRLILPAALGWVVICPWAGAEERLYEVGIAKVDITPDYPIRLTGYAARKTESEGVAQHIYAKAIAIGSDAEQPAILITVDNCGLPATVRDEVAARLQQKRKVDPDRLAVCSTHTHSAPWVKGFAPNIFGGPIPSDQLARVERYTRELTDALESVAVQALAERRPGKLHYGIGHAGFAANRRNQGGPVDQELPVLFLTDPSGELRAVFASYACHCTTLTGEFNQICGDWAGFAQEAIEREHPGALAMIGLGCAGDANPNPRPGFDLAKRHGEEIAKAVTQLLASPALGDAGQPNQGDQKATPLRRTIEGKLVCRTKQIELQFDTLPSRAEWELVAKGTNYPASHARLNLARLDRGETLPTRLSYMVQTWTFGTSLAMVFLPGEVVVDYSLRLKRELDSRRLWVNAYANDVPCYIPSERVLREGGYEGGGAMIYYDRPTKFSPGLEDQIISTVESLLPGDFKRRTARKSPLNHSRDAGIRTALPTRATAVAFNPKPSQ